MNTPDFPVFWFEANLYFDWVKSTDDLQTIFTKYHGLLSPDEILDRSHNNPSSDKPYYGMRKECIGDKTLRKFLEENKVDIGSI